MKIGAIFFALSAVIGISAGQIFFKLAASDLQKSNTLISWLTNLHMLTALSIYAVATVLWVLALQKMALNLAYAIMGLAFILVPLASSQWLEEKLTKGVLIGGVFIVVGIIISTSYKG